MTADALRSSRFAAAPALAVPGLAILVGLVLLGVVFHAEAVAAVSVWWSSTAYNHCFLVIPIAAWLAWSRRPSWSGIAPRPVPWVGLAALPVAFVWLVADRLGIMEGRQFAAMAAVELLFLGVLGWRLFGALSAGLLYLFFLVPSGAFLTPALQNFTAGFVVHGLDLLGIPHQFDGNLITIPAGRFYVAEACAGLRFLVASVAFGVLFACLMYRSIGRRVLFIAASIVIPVIANGIRALGIVVLGNILGNAQAAVADHLIYGWVFFSAVLLLLMLAGLPFRQDGAIAAPDRPITREGHAAGRIPLVLAALLPALLVLPGPLAARLLDGGENPNPSPVAAAFVGPPGCIPDPGGLPGQDFLCVGARITARLLVFAPRVGFDAISAAEGRLGGDRLGDEALTQTMHAPDGTAWQLAELQEPPRAIATAIGIDGRMGGGLRARLRQAEISMTGRGPPPVLAVVSATSQIADVETLTDDLRRFLAAQRPPVDMMRR